MYVIVFQTWRLARKWTWYAVTCRKTIWRSSAIRCRTRSTRARIWWETGRCGWPCGSWLWPRCSGTWPFYSCCSAAGSGWLFRSSSCATWQRRTFAWACTCCSSHSWMPGRSATTSTTPYSGREVSRIVAHCIFGISTIRPHNIRSPHLCRMRKSTKKRLAQRRILKNFFH